MLPERAGADRKIANMKAVVHKLAWLYRSMYYRLYRYGERVDGKYSDRNFIASIRFSVVLMCNFYSLDFIYLIISRERTLLLGFLPMWAVGALAASFCVLHGFFLGYKGRYKKIVAEFSKESRELEHRRNKWAVWYGLISVFLVFGLGATWAILK